MTRRIVHYTNRGGRYGNQLVQFAHWIAYACEHPGTEIAFLPYWPMCELSRGTETNPYCIFPFDPARPPKVSMTMRSCHRLLSGKHSNRRRFSMWALDHLLTPMFGNRHARSLPPPQTPLSDPQFTQAVEKLGKTVYVKGYAYRDWSLVEKHQERIREFLAPARRFVEAAERFIAPLRERYQTLIGVFIRQGDYRGWHSGSFFLSSERYVQLIKQLRERFGEQAVFIIASDEAQNPELFAEVPHAFAPGQATGRGHYLENVAALSMCDYIVTVPSTSGVFPAFFGNVPIIPIYGQNADMLTAPILRNHLFDSLRDRIMAMSIN